MDFEDANSCLTWALPSPVLPFALVSGQIHLSTFMVLAVAAAIARPRQRSYCHSSCSVVGRVEQGDGFANSFPNFDGLRIPVKERLGMKNRMGRHESIASPSLSSVIANVPRRALECENFCRPESGKDFLSDHNKS